MKICTNPLFQKLMPPSSVAFIFLKNVSTPRSGVFCQTCIFHHVWGKLFKFMVLRLLENVFVSRKNESFYSSSHAPEQTPSRFLLSHPQGERYYTFPPGSFFLKILILFSRQKRQGEKFMS